MVKNKSNIVGKVLIWTAIAIYGGQIVYLLTRGDTTMFRTGFGNAILWFMLVIGGQLMRE